MKVGLDIDGVVADFTGHIHTLYEPWFGEPCPIVWNNWTDYDMSPHFPHWADCQNWADKAHLWATMPLIDGAFNGIDQLLQAGHELFFLTARKGATCVDQTRFWFMREILSRFANVGPGSLREGLSGGKAAVRCDIYIDDGPHELAALEAAGRKTIRFAHPWNDCHQTATATATNWSDVLSIIGDMK